MNERIIEIILYLITRLQENENIEQSDVKKLADGGYSDAEIGVAFSWIARKDAIEESAPRSKTTGFRVLHQGERHLFTPEAWGYLIHLVTLSVLSHNDLEEIIDHAMMVGSERLALADVRRLTSSIMIDSVEPNMMGARFALQAQESIH